ncbi:hypothetical protein [uncultured Mailhella sp.]|uniref:hypothetical protein n=1 Tax=uncultured Mailhella sp. TaxID=1981031 RepID=UPI0025E5F661|nr:hypothetical protein [uncultured Mailhella sp.]
MFRDEVMDDVRAVFMSLDEFGERIEIDGKTIIAVRTEDGKFEAASLEPELPQRVIVLYAETSELLPEMTMGASVTLNGELCLVVSREDDLGGMSRLELTRRGY